MAKSSRRQRRKRPVTVYCNYCGEPLTRRVSEVRRNKTGRFYCDIHCQNKFQQAEKAWYETLEQVFEDYKEAWEKLAEL